jgi:hypothetical protein
MIFTVRSAFRPSRPSLTLRRIAGMTLDMCRCSGMATRSDESTRGEGAPRSLRRGPLFGQRRPTSDAVGSAARQRGWRSARTQARRAPCSAFQAANRTCAIASHGTSTSDDRRRGGRTRRVTDETPVRSEPMNRRCNAWVPRPSRCPARGRYKLRYQWTATRLRRTSPVGNEWATLALSSSACLAWLNSRSRR